MSRQPHEDRFASKCVELKFLNAENAIRLQSVASREHSSSGTVAMRLGLLTAELVDIVESLLARVDIAPGYELLEVVGRGGMGVVYRARQIDLDRIVAIKMILLNGLADPNVIKRFEREALTVARLQHQNIVQAWNYGHHNGRYFLAMEYIPGKSCLELIADGRRLPPLTAWSFVRQTASGLSHAHRHDVIHRDIKPANLLVMPPSDGASLPPGVDMIKIADFGLAMMSNTSEEQARLTTANALVGSPAYMSPEQFIGDSIDYRSDIYSLGATALTLLTSRTPFTSKSFGQLAALKQAGLSEDNPLLAGLPPDQRTLLLRMMASDRDQRPQEYAQLIQSIDSLAIADRPHQVGTSSLNLAYVHASDSAIGSDEVTQAMFTASTTAVTQLPGTRKFLLFGGLCAIFILCGAYFAFPKSAAGPRDFTNIRSTKPLFDGVSLAGWDVGGSMIGPWNVAHAPDDSSAITCFAQRGAITCRLPDWPHQRVSLFVYLTNDDVIADFDFGFVLGEATAPRGTLRLTTKSICIGTKISDFGDLQVLCQRPAPSTIRDRYHVLDVERQATDWYVFFEQQFIGSIPINDKLVGNTLRIIVSGNDADEPNAFFADVQTSELSESKKVELERK